MEQLEKDFHKAMIRLYQNAKDEIGYNATRFLQVVSQKGGLPAAKELLRKESTSGFATLYMEGRLDLSLEVYVLKDEYDSLFTDEEKRICKDRLNEYNYKL